MSTNPFKKHVNTLCADRGADVDASIAYASEVINALPPESRAYAMTALMVVINTASNAWDQQAADPSPEKMILFQLIDQRIRGHVTEALADIDDRISRKLEQALDNLDGKLDDWVNNSLSFEDACDNRIERWIENNLDVSSQVEGVVNDMDLSEKLENTINDLDLVVRIR